MGSGVMDAPMNLMILSLGPQSLASMYTFGWRKFCSAGLMAPFEGAKTCEISKKISDNILV